jgi:hypothetical protein
MMDKQTDATDSTDLTGQIQAPSVASFALRVTGYALRVHGFQYFIKTVKILGQDRVSGIENPYIGKWKNIFQPTIAAQGEITYERS